VSRSKYSVRLLRTAENDFSDIVSYIAADQPSAARVLAARIEKSLLHLSRNPRMGRIPDEADLARLGYRYLVIENYLVFYVVEGRSIQVHRILHGARHYLDLL
jgi:toxin ParE1/3/4